MSVNTFRQQINTSYTGNDRITDYLHYLQWHINSYIFCCFFFLCLCHCTRKQDCLQIRDSFLEVLLSILRRISCTTQKGSDLEHVFCVWGLVLLHHFAVQADWTSAGCHASKHWSQVQCRLLFPWLGWPKRGHRGTFTPWCVLRSGHAMLAYYHLHGQLWHDFYW